MKNHTAVKLGVVPTQRPLFPLETAREYKQKIYDAIRTFEVEVVDIEDVAENGMLSRQEDVLRVIRKFRDAEIDALFIPHCNFGSEGVTTQVCRALQVPVLLYGPRDEGPDAQGGRLRDSQCGLFATGKVLRRNNVPFSYITNSAVDSETFRQGFEKFLRVANVVRSMRNMRVLQFGPRPGEFLSVMVNESELLEKFGIQVFPIALPELEERVLKLAASDSEELKEICGHIRGNFTGRGAQDEEIIRKFAALKIAIRQYAKEFRCNCAAIMCWDAFSVPLGIVPCAVNALLAEEGFPVACETDICGAVSSILLQAAAGDSLPCFFADITIRHPEDENTELLWHCGPFPRSFAADPDGCEIRDQWTGAGACGNCYWECREGPVTVCRFDGDHGDYRLFIGEGESVSGPKSMGTYLWMKVDDWAKWEHTLVCGPYIHHVAGTYRHVADVLYEACKYIPGLTADPVFPTACDLEKRWRG